MSSVPFPRTAPAHLATERLSLRLVEERDWDSLYEMLGDEECVRYTIKSPLTRWQTWRMLAAYIGHWQLRGYGPYAVVEHASADTIGIVGLWFPGDWPEPEIKWSLTRRMWGRGFATEAARAVRDMAARELGWERLISLILPENQRSKAIARRLGRVHERTIPFRDDVADVFRYDLTA